MFLSSNRFSSFLVILLSSLPFLAFVVQVCQARTVEEHGRSRSLDDDLAKAVDAEGPDKYWSRVTEAWRDYAQERADGNLKSWKKIKTESLGVGKKCADVLEYMIRHPIEEEWTAKMINSMSSYPAGLLSGSTTELGDFDQCLAVDGTFSGEAFVGKYCLATVHLPKRKLFTPLNLTRNSLKPAWVGKILEQWHNNDNWYALATAVCFPSICSQNEIRSIAKAYYPILKSFDFNVTYCQTRIESQSYHPGIWVAVWILVISFVPIVLGTLLEAFTSTGNPDRPTTVKSPVGKFLLAYSAIGNTKILFRLTDSNSSSTTKEEVESSSQSASQEGSGQFAYIHGIRALASLFAMYVHTFGLMMIPLNMKVSPYSRYPNDMKETNKLFIVQPIFTAALVVQTFFSMSGMLLTYNALAPKLKISFIPYVLLRWLRYTPPVIGLICLTMATQIIGNGPLFHHDLVWPHVQRCYDSWWLNLLYVNNFSDFNEQCSIQTWYLSAEMQLHVIGFLLLLAYTRSPKLAYITSILLVVVGLAIMGFIVGLSLSPLTLFQIYAYTQYPVPVKSGRLLYMMPYMQFPSYFLSGIVGQLLLEKRKLALPKWLSTSFNVITATVFLTYPFMTYPFISQDKVYFEPEPGLQVALPYVTLIFLWGFANAWLLYRLALTPKGFLTRLLSAKIFQPLSRLSFSLYLVHTVTIWYNSLQTRTTISFANVNELHKQTSLTLVQSLVLAYLLYLTYEAPSVNLMKMLLGGKKDDRSKTKKQEAPVEEKKVQ